MHTQSVNQSTRQCTNTTPCINKGCGKWQNITEHNKTSKCRPHDCETSSMKQQWDSPILIDVSDPAPCRTHHGRDLNTTTVSFSKPLATQHIGELNHKWPCLQDKDPHSGGMNSGSHAVLDAQFMAQNAEAQECAILGMGPVLSQTFQHSSPISHPPSVTLALSCVVHTTHCI